MKTIKVSDATNTQLDWLVAKCWFTDRRVELNCLGHLAFAVEKSPGSGDSYTGWMPFSPTTDWPQMGPIIERERISAYWNTGEDYCRARVAGLPICTKGTTPLIAAARCYVVSKLGDTVDVPEELC